MFDYVLWHGDEICYSNKEGPETSYLYKPNYNSMSSRLMWVIVVILAIIIAVLAWFLVMTPATTTPTPTTTTDQTDTTNPNPTPTTGDDTSLPLSQRITITSPLPNGKVGKIITVTGQAPGPWYFEASFPVQVRDKENNVIGQIAAQALSDWQTPALVPFKATVTITGNYTGPATLILMKDNPSGLPENDDSVSIPIVIQ